MKVVVMIDAVRYDTVFYRVPNRDQVSMVTRGWLHISFREKDTVLNIVPKILEKKRRRTCGF